MPQVAFHGLLPTRGSTTETKGAFGSGTYFNFTAKWCAVMAMPLPR